MKAKYLVGMIWGIISGFHGFELYLTAVPGHQIISKAACALLGPQGWHVAPKSSLSWKRLPLFAMKSPRNGPGDTFTKEADEVTL